jgi:hypothetical protein
MKILKGATIMLVKPSKSEQPVLGHIFTDPATGESIVSRWSEYLREIK